MRVEFLSEHTPVETYQFRGRRIFVKRDDLVATPPLPPLGKLRGLKRALDQLTSAGVKVVGCWDTRVSKLTQGVAVLAQQYPRLRAIISYPQRKGEPLPEPVQIAQAYGAEIYPVRGNFPRIAWSQARHYVEQSGGFMLPFGLTCWEAVGAVATEAASVPPEFYAGGTVVLSVGSGVTVSGLLLGLRAPISRLIAVSSGRSLIQIAQTISHYVTEPPTFLELQGPLMAYADIPGIRCPFPCHPNYDLKAWLALTTQLGDFKDPILFWNIGA